MNTSSPLFHLNTRHQIQFDTRVQARGLSYPVAVPHFRGDWTNYQLYTSVVPGHTPLRHFDPVRYGWTPPATAPRPGVTTMSPRGQTAQRGHHRPTWVSPLPRTTIYFSRIHWHVSP